MRFAALGRRGCLMHRRLLNLGAPLPLELQRASRKEVHIGRGSVPPSVGIGTARAATNRHKEVEACLHLKGQAERRDRDDKA